MPIEIKELVIRVSVGESASGQNRPQGAAGQQTSGGGGGASKEEIVAECVEQILERLKNKNER